MILTRAFLDKAGCSIPNCGHDHTVIHLHGRCHPHAGVQVSYTKATGILRVECGKCDTLIAEIAVSI